MMKTYLVACYGLQDCIDTMKRIYLKLKAKYPNDLIMMNKEQHAIVSRSFLIQFKTSEEICRMNEDLLFYGMVKSYQYQEFTQYDTKDAYEHFFLRTKRFYGKNDCENFIKPLVIGERKKRAK